MEWSGSPFTARSQVTRSTGKRVRRYPVWWPRYMTRRLTVAQATLPSLANQFVERDGRQSRFFEGCFGIFGHGNVAGIGQALEQDLGLPYYLFRNEQAMVHAAAAFAKASFRMRTMVCTTSIGPGATNMVTGAAAATINRVPVLLLPGDMFARRNVAPVLQQLESPSTQDISVNDCFKPVSRYWDRIRRPEQLLTSLPEAMRVLTSPAETGAVTFVCRRMCRPKPSIFRRSSSARGCGSSLAAVVIEKSCSVPWNGFVRRKDL